jgi:hypothetical protein
MTTKYEMYESDGWIDPQYLEVKYVKQDDIEGWYIVCDDLNAIVCGPYDTEEDAQDDLNVLEMDA